MRIFAIIVLSGWLVATAGASDTAVFSYKVADHPKTLATCQATGDEIAARFTQSTGLTLYKMQAWDQGKTRCDLTISYLAEEERHPVSTSPADPIIDGHDRWHYATPKACEDDLAPQRTLFEAQTGLRPLVAYCTSDTLFQAGLISILKVEAFGQPLKRPYYFTMPKGYDQQAPLNRDVSTAIVAAGGVVARVAVSKYQLNPDSHDGVFYYAVDSLGVTTLQVPGLFGGDYILPKEEQCRAQLEDAKQMVTALKGLPAAGICTKRQYHQGKFSQMQLVYLAEPLSVTGFAAKDGEYSSMDACLADRQRIVEIYQKQLGKDVKGALCTWRREPLQSSFNMILYMP